MRAAAKPDVAPQMFRAITRTALFDRTAASASMNRVADTSDASATPPPPLWPRSDWPTVWSADANAARVARRLGPRGTLVASKLAAFLRLCVGAQIMLAAPLDVLRAVHAPPA
jgi:hypothetical protein